MTETTQVGTPVAIDASSVDRATDARRATAIRWIDNLTPQLAHAWYPVALSAEVGTEVPVGVELFGEHWVLARLDGVLSAFVDECPHRLLPLSAGNICGNTIQCAYHGWRFESSGACVDIPSIGSGRTLPSKAALRRPAGLQERYGLIWLAPEAPVCDLLDVADFEDPAFEVRHDTPVRTPASAAQCLDNFVDTSHFLMVHAGTFGGDETAMTQPHTVSRDGWTLTAEYLTPYKVLDDPATRTGEVAELQFSRHTKSFCPGALAVLRMEFPETDSVFSILIAIQPESLDSSRLYRVWARDDIVGDEARWAEHLVNEAAVLAEDLAAFAIFRDHRISLDLRREVHVAADKLSVAYRRVLADLYEYGDLVAGEHVSSGAG